MNFATWAWLGGLAVGVTSNEELGLDAVRQDAAIEEWSARHAPSDGEEKTLPDALHGPLHFQLTWLQIPKITAFGPILEAYLQREMARGWEVSGRFGPGGEGPREAVFTRRHRRWGLNWGMPGTATPVPCTKDHAQALACYLVKPKREDGAAYIKLGGTLGELRVFPRAHVAFHRGEKPGTWRADTRLLTILRREDAAKLKVPPGELGSPMRSTLSAILEGLMVAPTVDGDDDGRPDAWRFEAAAGFKVTPVESPEKKGAEKK